MAIQPPSDILLDVANAADPAKVRAATARLARLAAEPNAVDADFGKALKAADGEGRKLAYGATGGLAGHPTIPSSGAPAASRSRVQDSARPYQKFEAVLLQNFVEAMLPKDDELYGDKTSAGIYRSMMAEQFASELSKAGGIGIAKAIEAKHPSIHSAAGAQAAATPLDPGPTKA